MVINTLSEYVAMSYDMSIGEEDFNYTYNVSKMWYAAIQILDALRYIRPLVETEYRRIFALRAEK